MMKGLPITEQLYDYIVETFAPEDALLKAMPADAEKQGVPLIHISPEQGKFLQVLMRACNAKRVIEIGSLFGYSALWMARALPADGKLFALELSPLHVKVIRQNAQRAGLSDKIEVIEGDARETLKTLQGPFDFAFVDAEKMEYIAYYEQVMTLLRPGAIIVADNASGHGDAWNSKAKGNVPGIRAMNQRMASDPRITALLVPISDGMCVGVVNA